MSTSCRSSMPRLGSGGGRLTASEAYLLAGLLGLPVLQPGTGRRGGSFLFGEHDDFGPDRSNWNAVSDSARERESPPGDG